MIIYLIFQWLLILVAAILIGYQLLLSFLALLPQHKQGIAQPAFNHSFLLVIHLKNKEQELSKTLYSLYSLVYPSNLFKLIVITDSCTYTTANAARKIGATVLHPKNEQYKSPSAALYWALEQIPLWEETYDAVVVIEPGGLISGNFLEIMNHCLEEGSDILQCSLQQVISSGSWRINFIHTARLIYNHINSLGRKKLGLSTRLMGNGMCFRTKVLKNISAELYQTIAHSHYRWPLVVKGVQVDFVPGAVIWSQSNVSPGEHALHGKKADSSQLKMIKEHVRKGISGFIDNTVLQNFDALVRLVMPSTKALIIGTTGMALINWGLWKLGFISASFFWVWLILLGIVTFYLLIGVVTARAIFSDLNNTSKRTAKPDFNNALLSRSDNTGFFFSEMIERILLITVSLL